MDTKKHPRDLSDAVVSAFDDRTDEAYLVTDSATLAELRAAASARWEAEGRIEAAALAAHRAGLSWGVIGAQLGMTRPGARQRFDVLVFRPFNTCPSTIPAWDSPPRTTHNRTRNE